jgi:hypothetical protein
VDHLENLQEEFQRRLQEFSLNESVTEFEADPFSAVDVCATATLIGNILQADVEEL